MTEYEIGDTVSTHPDFGTVTSGFVTAILNEFAAAGLASVSYRLDASGLRAFRASGLLSRRVVLTEKRDARLLGL